MPRGVSLIAVLGTLVLAAGVASAGVPQGLTISADEQIADETKGVTIARGRAEIKAQKYALDGRADVIEVRPAIDEVLFKGSAVVRIGAREYRGAMLSCTLDFARCAAVDETQPLPASALSAAETEPR